MTATTAPDWATHLSQHILEEKVGDWTEAERLLAASIAEERWRTDVEYAAEYLELARIHLSRLEQIGVPHP